MWNGSNFSERDTETRRALCLEIKQHVPHAAVLYYSVTRQIFTCVMQWIIKTSDTGPKTTIMSCMNALCIVNKWMYGVLWHNLVHVMGSILLWRRQHFSNCELWSILWNARHFSQDKIGYSPWHGDNVWFQQDEATACTSRRAMGILRVMFPGHLISMRSDMLARPYSWFICANFSFWDTSSQRYTLIALNLLNNLKMQYVKKLNFFIFKTITG